MLMKQFVGEFTSGLILMALGQFFISARHDNACPFLKTLDFVHLKASMRVGAQLFDFLADRGETVDTLIVIGKIAGRNIGLPLIGAGKTAQTASSQEVHACPFRQYASCVSH